MPRRHFEGWLSDVFRASIVTILYLAGMGAGLSKSIGYVGLAGVLPFVFALILGPWAAAWVACKLVPSDRRLLVRLSAGSYSGLILFLIVLYAISVLTSRWPRGDHPSRLTEGGEAFLFVVGLLLCVLASTLAFSRWRSRTST
jgi:hypothetical protein